MDIIPQITVIVPPMPPEELQNSEYMEIIRRQGLGEAVSIDDILDLHILLQNAQKIREEIKTAGKKEGFYW